jgi:hypothetical protein
MLRVYFLFHRELLRELARISYETVREMMAIALDEPNARPGMVAVIQTFGSSLKWNPHIHAIVSRGLWDRGSSLNLVSGLEQQRRLVRCSDRAKSGVPLRSRLARAGPRSGPAHKETGAC